MNHQRPLRVNRHQRRRALRRAQVQFFIDFWRRYNEAREILGHDPYHVLKFTCYGEPLHANLTFEELNALALESLHQFGLAKLGDAPCPSQNNFVEPSSSPETEAS